jgi:hypothetical protein
MKLLTQMMEIVMPTPPPPPVEDAKDENERMARIGAVAFVEKFGIALHDWSYSSRSYMPGGDDGG